MSVVVSYLTYLLISISLTLLVGRALARYGRLVLLDVLGGDDSTADGISKLHVVAFYLLTLGFITLTMRISGDIGSARQAFQLLAVKIGEVLLVLGVLYLGDITLLNRLRRRAAPQRAAPRRVTPQQVAPPHRVTPRKVGS
jgi:hypothetical protein